MIGQILAKSWPGNQPDLCLREVITKEISGSVIPAWGQENGGPLSVEEVADVREYILTLSPPPSLPPPRAPSKDH